MQKQTFYIEELDLSVVIHVVKDGESSFRDGNAVFGNKFPELFPKFNKESQFHKNMINDITSLIVAHACAGVKIWSNSYVQGLKTFFDYRFGD